MKICSAQITCAGVPVTSKGFSGSHRCPPCDAAVRAGEKFQGEYYRCCYCLEPKTLDRYFKGKNSVTGRAYVCTACYSKIKAGDAPSLKEMQEMRTKKTVRTGNHRRYCNADFGYACCCRGKGE